MVGLNYKLLEKFNIGLYWFILNRILCGVQITNLISKKYLIVKKEKELAYDKR
jgi:hypothetical protein